MVIMKLQWNLVIVMVSRHPYSFSNVKKGFVDSCISIYSGERSEHQRKKSNGATLLATIHQFRFRPMEQPKQHGIEDF